VPIQITIIIVSLCAVIMLAMYFVYKIQKTIINNRHKTKVDNEDRLLKIERERLASLNKVIITIAESITPLFTDYYVNNSELNRLEEFLESIGEDVVDGESVVDVAIRLIGSAKH